MLHPDKGAEMQDDDDDEQDTTSTWTFGQECDDNEEARKVAMEHIQQVFQDGQDDERFADA